jgi:LmbE family N-acetylglucosaminyl deacetylase
MARRVFAIAAHPDDIEFMMAGTFLLLGQAGYELHYLTLADGGCGTQSHDAQTIVQIRRQEAQDAARFAHAIYHESLTADLEIFYERDTLRRLAALVREVAPEIILTQSTQEYMEDHMNTTRLVLTAAFARGMPNFSVIPPQPAIDQPVTVYHALPYGLRDPLRRRVRPGLFVDITEVQAAKRAMLALHRSQHDWLAAPGSQGLDSCLRVMERMAQEVGELAHQAGHPACAYAEGWTRHLHLGYCTPDANPLADALGPRVLVSPDFEAALG